MFWPVHLGVLPGSQSDLCRVYHAADGIGGWRSSNGGIDTVRLDDEYKDRSNVHLLERQQPVCTVFFSAPRHKAKLKQ